MKFLFMTICLLIPFTPVFATNEAALLFLLTQPSPKAAGMGNASVASFEHNPLNSLFNPAHVGFAGLIEKINLEFYFDKIKAMRRYGSRKLDSRGGSLTYGHSLNTMNGWALNLGLSYARVFPNYVQLLLMDDTGPEAISLFEANDTADILSIGLRLKKNIQLSVGMNYKFINSRIENICACAERITGDANAHSFDIGIYIEAPIIKPIKHLSTGEKASYLNASLGIVRANVGNRVIYFQKKSPTLNPESHV